MDYSAFLCLPAKRMYVDNVDMYDLDLDYVFVIMYNLFTEAEHGMM